ncbi:MAG: hypothetical protein GVY32_10095 [Gammaproteobacteria bacterium]|jgi:hypothetical protein|nr:hypothetical protein [Gammaproteobacteria bacterium]
MKRVLVRAMLAAILLAAAQVHAQPLDDDSVAALERFYEDFNGDEWSRNDGWMDPEIDPCDWYGVGCDTWGGEFVIRTLTLPGNNLSGDWSGTDIFEYVISSIDLRDNALTGSLSRLPQPVEIVLLSGNDLSGTLPERPSNYGDSLYELDLARNDIQGAVPQSWRQLDVPYLDLSGNRLTQGWQNALLAAQNYINIADNEFSGSLDEAGVVVTHLLDHNDSVTAGGINLCWNDFSITSEIKIDQIEQRHVGGANFLDCLGRQRAELNAGISGSWFDPSRSGEGISSHLLESGGVLLYHFGFDGAGRQHWLIGVGQESGRTLHWTDRIISTSGRFGDGMVDEESGGIGFGIDWRIDRLGADLVQIERVYADFSGCPLDPPTPMPCAARMHSNRFDYDRLSELAGTRCDNQHPLQHLSGAWFDSERSGEGFVVEVLEDGRGLVYWFTYRPDESMHQAWMIGTGDFDGQTLSIDEMIRPIGGAWGEDFNPDAVVDQPWGSLTLDFTDGESGHAYWDSIDPAYGSGDHPIERLSRVRLAECH